MWTHSLRGFEWVYNEHDIILSIKYIGKEDGYADILTFLRLSKKERFEKKCRRLSYFKYCIVTLKSLEKLFYKTSNNNNSLGWLQKV